MARAKTRRPRARRARSKRQVPDILTVGRSLWRPEVIGTALVLAAAATIPYLIPLTGIVGELRNSLVSTFGLHIFTLIALIGAMGLALALRRRFSWPNRRRHVTGLAAVLVFLTGLLGQWYPDTRVGDVSLLSVSAGGEVGRVLSTNGWTVAGWLLMLPVAFALLWPRTAASFARELPRATWDVARWLWSLNLHHHAWRGVMSAVRSVPLFVRGLNNRVGVNADPEPMVGPDTPLPPEIEAIAGPPSPDLKPTSVAEDGANGGKPATQLPMDLDTPVKEWRHSADGWQLPPVTLLKAAPTNRTQTVDNERRADLIIQTLASFGIDASVVEINEGPAVTQFGVEPGWDIKTRTVTERDANGQPILDASGQPRTKEIEVSRTRIRVNRITALQNDLALALAAPALRIEAPVPGKPMVGIEVPNATTAVVSMRGIVESPAYRKFAPKAALPLALGSGVSGEPVMADLARMPHLLIAGATGSGKSVCLNSIITGLLMNYSPEQLRFVMIDPKRVELAAFGEIPHLAFSEIVVEMDRVVGTLQAVINEMESRYRRFAKAGVRNIERYNEKHANQKLPYWVVVIDELADLMLVAPYQVENQLVRLAQLARATGIHLIVATQRPSVDVITGLIKANFPTRIAFAVSSQVDSRTILDQAGAEKLLGKGDMLYVPPDAQKPKRVQGVFVADEEIDAVVKFWTADRFRELVPQKYDQELEKALQEAEHLAPDGTVSAPDDDPMLQKAVDVARGGRSLSTSMLQRKLGIGYPRAARLMDLLEDRGVVGPQEPGGKSRPVLLDAEGEPAGGADAEHPASLAAHAAAFTPGDRRIETSPESPRGDVTEEQRERLRAGPPRPFDAD